MKRTWVMVVAALLMAAFTARLGWWQLDRAAQKLALQAEQDARQALPPLEAGDWPTHADGVRAHEHRRTLVRGVWLNEESVYLDNRPMAGRPGFYLVTPLRLDDGTAVLVQRGWLPRDAQDRTRVAAPPGKAGTLVEVSGRMAPALPRLYELQATETGLIRQNLDIESFARERRLRLKPWVLVQQGGPSPSDTLLRDWPAPNTGVHKHYGYAFQWFALSVLIIGLLAWFQFIRPRRQAARALT